MACERLILVMRAFPAHPAHPTESLGTQSKNLKAFRLIAHARGWAGQGMHVNAAL
jgi:hypothetical protein